MNNPVNITVFRWAGAWGPFKVKIPCGECALTKDIIQDCIDTDLTGIDVELDLRDWLTEWWKPLPKGGWHAPIVLVNGRIVSQGAALNRGVLTQSVIEEAVSDTPIQEQSRFRQGYLPPLRTRQGIPGAGGRRLPVSRRRKRPPGTLRNAGTGKTDHRPQNPGHRAADLAGRPLCRRRR